MATKPPSNTMALVSLLAGIFSFVCLGAIGAILALIFGFLGLSRAKQMNGNGKGMSIAGIILGILNLIVTAVVIVLIVVFAGSAKDSLNEAIQNIGGTAPASSYEVKVTACSADSMGSVTFNGTITNRTAGSKSFIVQTSVTDSGGAEISTIPAIVTDIPAGATETWDANSFGDPVGSITCKVTGVNNFFN